MDYMSKEDIKKIKSTDSYKKAKALWDKYLAGDNDTVNNSTPKDLKSIIVYLYISLSEKHHYLNDMDKQPREINDKTKPDRGTKEIDIRDLETRIIRLEGVLLQMNRILEQL